MFPERYNTQSLRRLLAHPSLLNREVGRLLSRFLYPIQNARFERQYGSGIDVMEQDWDNLILLDACRYDSFVERNTIEGDLRPVLSRGAHSWEFMEANFVGRTLHDTVYVTGNPHAPKLPDGTFHAVEMAHNPMEPEKTVEMALDAVQTYPNKRLIVHLMPPHRPHLGPTVEQLREEYDFVDHERPPDERSGKTIWRGVMESDITSEQLRRVYNETLDVGLNLAERILDTVEGKSVVSSDHGELLGERAFPLTHRRYGHPHDVDTWPLRVVPWLEIESTTRREIRSDPPVDIDQLDEDTIEERLAALGYK